MPVIAEPRLTPGPRSSAPAEGIEQRAVAALLRCVARHGLGKTTLDDVAREAGCARATLYRYFGGKRQLVRAALATESARISAEVKGAADAESTLEDAVVAVLAVATRQLREHAALEFLLAFEPEIVLPHVTFAAGDRFLRVSGAVLAPAFEPYVGPERAPRAGEWVVRLVLSYCAAPNAPTDSIDLTDDATTRTLVREFVLPGLVDRSSPATDTTRG
jgi:AcrR family transcriptional regulator